MFQNGRSERERLHLSLGKPLMMASLNSTICLSSSAAVLIRSKTGSATEVSEPFIVLIMAALAEKEGGPSASSSSGDAMSTGARDNASASRLSLPRTQRAVNWYRCIFSRRRRMRGLSSL